MKLCAKLFLGLATLFLLGQQATAGAMRKESLTAIKAATRELGVALEARPPASSRHAADILDDLDQRLATLRPPVASGTRSSTLSAPKAPGTTILAGKFGSEGQAQRLEETHLPTPLGLDQIAIARAFVADLKRAIVVRRENESLRRDWQRLSEVIDAIAALQE